jgi:hypothetical protein
VLPRPFKQGVQPPVAAQPPEGPFNHSADAGRNELSVPAAGNRLDGDAEVPTGFGQSLAPVTKIAQRRTLEASIGKLTQDRDDAFRIMHVRWRDIDRQGNAAVVDGNLDLDRTDLLPAVDAARKAACCRATGSTVDDHSTRLWGITARVPPGAAQPG